MRRANRPAPGEAMRGACPASSSCRPTSLYKFVSHTLGLTHKLVIDGGCSATSTGQANCQPLHRIWVPRGDLALEVGPLTWWFFCSGAPTQGMEPRAKHSRMDPEHITASIPEEVWTYDEWAMYPVDVLQLVCSQVGLAPAGSKHEMARRLVGFFQLVGAGTAGGPGTSTAGGNDGTWLPSASPVASVLAVPPPVAHPVIPPFQFARLGLAAEVPDEVIQPVHDQAQEVVPLQGDELSSFFHDAICREAIALAQAWSVPPALCTAAHPPPSGATHCPRPSPPAHPSPPARPTSYGSVSHSGLATPLLEKLRTGMYVDFHSILHASEDGAPSWTDRAFPDYARRYPGRRDGPAIPPHPHIGLPHVVPGMGRVFRTTVWYHPHLCPHLAVYQVGMNRYVRDYPPYMWVAFDAEFRQSVANNLGCLGTACTPWHSITICTVLLLPPPTPAVRQPLAGRPMPPSGSGRRSGICRDYNAWLCMWATCRYEHSCTWCGGTHPAFSCPPQWQPASLVGRRPSLLVGPLSPMDAHLLHALMRGHPRWALVSYLWSGFTFGFTLGYRGPVMPAWPHNLLLVCSLHSAVTAVVAQEVSRGHTAGPFVRPPFRLFHCSPPPPRCHSEVRRLCALGFGFVLASRSLG